MRLGFGTTAWCERRGGLDGIGHYTRELYRRFSEFEKIELAPLSFSPCKNSRDAPRNLRRFPVRFPLYGASRVFLPFLGDGMGTYRERIDLFFAPDHHIPILQEVPVVATVMDMIPFRHPEWASPRMRRLKNYLFARTIDKSEHLITFSKYSKRDIMEVLGIAEHQISVVSLGVDRRFFQKVPDKIQKSILESFHLNAGYFLAVGTLQPRKNLRMLIQAHRRLPRILRSRHPLVMVGKYGWESDKLVSEIEAMTQEGTGKWLSYVDDTALRVLLRNARALTFPSLYEGFGLPVLEAFASGCPVISSNTTSLPEVASDAAILLDPEDVEGWTEAMRHMAEEDSLRERLIAKGLLRVGQYSWERSAHQHLEVFRALLGKYYRDK